MKHPTPTFLFARSRARILEILISNGLVSGFSGQESQVLQEPSSKQGVPRSSRGGRILCFKEMARAEARVFLIVDGFCRRYKSSRFTEAVPIDDEPRGSRE